MDAKPPRTGPVRPSRRRWLSQALACVLPLPAGCGRDTAPPPAPVYRDRPPAAAVPVWRFAVHPLHNPRLLMAAYHPLVAYLNARVPGVRIELEASRDYHAYEAKLRARGPELVLPNPWQTLLAMDRGYHVIAMAGDADDFRGLILVRRDGPVHTLPDLRGRTVSYPSPTALAACMMPQAFLVEHGIDVMHDINNVYVGSQESSIMNVYLGKSDAGATRPPPWRLFQRRHPAEAARLEVKWRTPPLLNNSVMARDDLPPVMVAGVRTALLELDHSAEGQAILAGMETTRFHPADDASYGQVRDYIARFERAVRPVEAR